MVGAPCGFGDAANPGTGHRGRLRRSIRLIWSRCVVQPPRRPARVAADLAPI